MKDLFEVIFRSFWTFAGTVIILYIPFGTIEFMWNRYWRHKNIRIHGYPPNTDADGDFKQKN